MTSTLPSHTWIARYCKRAIHLVPGLSTTAAVRQAVAAYPYALSMHPEGAAEMYTRLSDIREAAEMTVR